MFQQFHSLRSVTLLLVFSATSFLPAIAQETGNQAEMERLEIQADELLANGDPSGAALAIGKAAMMAGIMAKQERSKSAQDIFGGIEALFRTQEHGYRALALFEQAGGQPPAPNGVCEMLRFSQQQNTKADALFSKIDSKDNTVFHESLTRYSQITHEWFVIIHDLNTDFQCSSSLSVLPVISQRIA